MKIIPYKALGAVVVLGASMALLPGTGLAQSTPISTIYTTGPGSYTVTGTVTAILDLSATSNTIILSDATGSIIDFRIPLATYTAKVGDNVTYTVPDTTFSGSPELGTPTSTVTVNSSGNAVTPTVLTVPQFNLTGTGSTTKTAVPPNAEALVTLNNVTFPAGTTTLNTATNTAYILTDSLGNTTTFFAYHSYSNTLAALNAANSQQTASGNTFYANPVNVTGYADVFNGVAEIYPLSITAAPEPSTYAMLGVGGVALAFFVRNVRRASRL